MKNTSPKLLMVLMGTMFTINIIIGTIHLVKMAKGDKEKKDAN